ncbi:MAG TPA: PH domain-containing protein [Candidatus Limnocylindria bacterium]|nr:PH domain-containing protein [Candidatus Limnocylindria bacterium]
MGYAEKLLSRGEEIVYASRQHWFAVVAETFWWIVGAVVLLALAIFLASNQAPVVNDGIDGVLTVATLLGLLLAVGRIALKVWDWRNQEWLITNRRVIRSEGIFNKAMSDSNLEKINDAMLTQSWVGRIFNYGTLDILTAAEETGAHAGIGDFPMIAEPVAFKIAMLNQKELLERPDLAPARRPQGREAAPEYRREPLPPRAGSDRVSQVAQGAQELDDAVPAPAPVAPPPAPAEPSRAADDPAATLERLATLRDKGLITPEEYETKKQQILERF